MFRGESRVMIEEVVDQSWSGLACGCSAAQHDVWLGKDREGGILKEEELKKEADLVQKLSNGHP
jgi:hypothetical protein